MRLLLAAVVVALVVAPMSAVASDQVPAATLTQMGASGMQTLSDAQGDLIRGKAFVANIAIVNDSFIGGGHVNQSLKQKPCCGIRVNGVLVNDSSINCLKADQSIAKNRCCGVAINGLVINNACVGSIKVSQSIK